MYPQDGDVARRAHRPQHFQRTRMHLLPLSARRQAATLRAGCFGLNLDLKAKEVFAIHSPKNVSWANSLFLGFRTLLESRNKQLTSLGHPHDSCASRHCPHASMYEWFLSIVPGLYKAQGAPSRLASDASSLSRVVGTEKSCADVLFPIAPVNWRMGSGEDAGDSFLSNTGKTPTLLFTPVFPFQLFARKLSLPRLASTVYVFAS